MVQSTGPALCVRIRGLRCLELHVGPCDGWVVSHAKDLAELVDTIKDEPEDKGAQELVLVRCRVLVLDNVESQ